MPRSITRRFICEPERVCERIHAWVFRSVGVISKKKMALIVTRRRLARRRAACDEWERRVSLCHGTEFRRVLTNLWFPFAQGAAITP